jgi:hypothetical protein
MLGEAMDFAIVEVDGAVLVNTSILGVDDGGVY